MDVIIKNLNIKNFRQITSKDYTFNESVNRITGKNGSGKSNTLHALSWVFFGTDYASRTQFAIIPINADGTLSNKEPEVEVTFWADSKKHTLKRVLKEGSKTQTFIDGVPTKTLKEYNDFVSSIFESQERFKMFSNPFYFTEALNWKDQREMFMRFFPLPSNDEVIKEFTKLTALRTDMKDLGDRTFENEVDRIRNELKEAERERDSIRAKIELLDEQLEGSDRVSTNDELIQERDDLRKQVNDRQKEAIQRSKEIAEAIQKRNTLRTNIDVLNQEARNSKAKAESEKHHRLSELRTRIEKEERARKEFAERYKALKGSLEGTCERCGQDLPSDQLERAKHSRDKRLAIIVASGKEFAEQIAELKEEYKQIESRNPEYATPDQAINELNEQLEKIVVPDPLEPLGEDILNRLDDIERQVARYEVHAENITKRKEYQSRVSEISRVVEHHESRLLDLADLFQKRSEMLAKRVNKSFTNISVKVIEIQKNGTAKETFEVLKNGIPYRELNTAGQLEASLELTSFLKSKLGVKCPLLIDNGERYTDVEFSKLKDQMIIAIAVKGLGLGLEVK